MAIWFNASTVDTRQSIPEKYTKKKYAHRESKSCTENERVRGTNGMLDAALLLFFPTIFVNGGLLVMNHAEPNWWKYVHQRNTRMMVDNKMKKEQTFDKEYAGLFSFGLCKPSRLMTLPTSEPSSSLFVSRFPTKYSNHVFDKDRVSNVLMFARKSAIQKKNKKQKKITKKKTGLIHFKERIVWFYFIHYIFCSIFICHVCVALDNDDDGLLLKQVP